MTHFEPTRDRTLATVYATTDQADDVCRRFPHLESFLGYSLKGTRVVDGVLIVLRDPRDAADNALWHGPWYLRAVTP